MSFSVVCLSTKSITNNNTTGGIFTSATLGSNTLTVPSATQNNINITKLKAQSYTLSYSGTTATFTGIAPSPFLTPTTSTGSTNGTTLTVDGNYSPIATTLVLSGLNVVPATYTGFPAITSLTASQSGITVSFNTPPALNAGQIYAVSGGAFTVSGVDTLITGVATATGTPNTSTTSTTMVLSTDVLNFTGGNYYAITAGGGATGNPTFLAEAPSVANNTINIVSSVGTAISFNTAVLLTNGIVYSVVGAGIASNTTIQGDGTSKTNYTASISNTVSSVACNLYRRIYQLSSPQTLTATSATFTCIGFSTNNLSSATISSVGVSIYQRTYTLSITQPTQVIPILNYSPTTFNASTATQSAIDMTYITTPSATNSLQYYFDWTQIVKKKGLGAKSQKYKLTLAFQSNGMATSSPNSYAYIVLPDLGIAEFQYDLLGNTPQNNGIIGYIFPTGIGATGFSIQAGYPQNQPVYLEYLPTQNVFTVEIRVINSGALSPDFLATTNYILILNFEAITDFED